MKLYIDNREPKQIINYLNVLNENRKYTIEVTNLELGDYLIYDEINERTLVIIERKSLSDLESSIKDGRYNEQSFRLDGNSLPNHNIYYLIEGNIINYRNDKFKGTLYSSLVSISYYKGFSILNSVNNIESAELINSFVNKLLKENSKSCYYNNIENLSEQKEEYVNVVKTTKKANVTRDNINIIMLMQIPNVSHQSATAIIKKFKTLKDLTNALESDVECLDSLKLEGSNRKISKNVIQNIKEYLLN
jgi:ERCC4-type nuclease